MKGENGDANPEETSLPLFNAPRSSLGLCRTLSFVNFPVTGSNFVFEPYFSSFSFQGSVFFPLQTVKTVQNLGSVMKPDLPSTHVNHCWIMGLEQALESLSGETGCDLCFSLFCGSVSSLTGHLQRLQLPRETTEVTERWWATSAALVHRFFRCRCSVGS